MIVEIPAAKPRSGCTVFHSQSVTLLIIKLKLVRTRRLNGGGRADPVVEWANPAALFLTVCNALKEGTIIIIIIILVFRGGNSQLGELGVYLSVFASSINK